METLTVFLFVLNAVVVAFVFRQYAFTGLQDDADDLLLAKFDASYDYIVVGSGSSGSVVAARLSEDSSVSVLVLEAGHDDRGEELLYTPSHAPNVQHSKFDWRYFSEPQKEACWALQDKRSYWPRGRVLGGSSQLNYMAYVRGNKFDYNKWAEYGCDGWSYDDLLPYFKKSEDMQDETLAKSKYHGTGGPLKINKVATGPLPQIFLEAAKQAGYNETDNNGQCQEGFGNQQSSVGDGVRSSTSHSFLWPAARTRKNLHVAVYAHVTKIIIKNKKAVGVEFVKDGRRQQVKANKEVILSAGSIGTAQIMLLSGLGPKKHLDEMKIPVVADLPVGENLQDHLMIPLRILIDQPLSTSEEKLNRATTRLQYNWFKSGYRTTPSGNEFVAFARTRDDLPYGNPDLEYHMLVLLPNKFNTRKFFNIDPKIMAKLNWDAGEGFYVVPILLRPESVGTIRLKSSNPFDYPIINPNYLTAKEDMLVLFRGIRMFQKILKQDAFGKIGARQDLSLMPTCTQHEYDSDAYWQCYVRSLTVTVYHPIGTAKMGPPKDRTTVVDPQLRVKGISGLRVADASIMPFLVSGNTNAPCIMIGEKAADLIKGKKTV